mmetsp:Transcript_38923/g.39617  ORF Transcript_38923/g.39617 Transcript_38923/m.39617 type:complete len:107 (-) Transcript_38923:20-340(-)
MEWPVQRPRKAEDDDPDAYWGHDDLDSKLDNGSIDINDESHNNATTSTDSLGLEEVPFDRDVRWINIASGSRPRSKISANNPFMKQVQSITSHNKDELQSLDEHYK